MESKLRLEAGLKGKTEFKWRLKASLEGQVESKRRQEASLKGQVESTRRQEASLEGTMESKLHKESLRARPCRWSGLHKRGYDISMFKFRFRGLILATSGGQGQRILKLRRWGSFQASLGQG